MATAASMFNAADVLHASAAVGSTAPSTVLVCKVRSDATCNESASPSVIVLRCASSCCCDVPVTTPGFLDMAAVQRCCVASTTETVCGVCETGNCAVGATTGLESTRASDIAYREHTVRTGQDDRAVLLCDTAPCTHGTPYARTSHCAFSLDTYQFSDKCTGNWISA